MPLTALIFDLDGTLASSEPCHLLAFQQVCAPYGLAITPAFFAQNLSGRTNAQIGPILFPDRSPEEQTRITDYKEEVFRQMVMQVPPTAGALALLDWADDNGLKLAVVSNAPRANVDAVLSGLGITARFATTVAGEDVSHAKPNPEPYLTALATLGVNAAESIAFEDAVAGLTAAVAANIPTVGILTSQSPATLQKIGAILTVPDFTDGRLWTLLEDKLAANQGKAVRA